jgi:glycosyltransferase involved in cell wall biosynthesis
MFMLLESLDRGAWEPTLLLDDAAGVESLAERARGLRVPVRRVSPMPLGPGGARRVPALARLLRAERPAVFHAHMSSPVACKWALAAAVLARAPAVLGTVQVCEYEPPSRSAYWQLRALARGVDRYLAVSRDIADELVERLGWPAAKIEVLYNAVDPARFEVEAPAGLREELGAVGRPLVLTAARLDAQKGHPFLLRALAAVPEAVLALAGEGPERRALEDLAAEVGVADRVRFLGRREDVPQLLAACDVFALPSLYEGSSLAVLEAMAARRALVSSAIGGTDELVEDGRSGLLVPPGDAAALAAALRRLLADPELREELAANARERVERELTRERMAARVSAVYRELVGDGGLVDAAALPESRRNPELRRGDWRFAMPGAQLGARTRLPLPGAAARARRRAEAAGFEQVRVYWPGPLPHRPPQFWLPLDSPAARAHLLASRPPRSFAHRLLRVIWRGAARAGMLAPLYAVGRRDEADAEEGSLPTAPLLLLTGGHRSINKVVGLAFEPGAAAPSAAVKLARVAEAEPGLQREAEALQRVGAEKPGLRGVPRLLGVGRRAGALALVEEAVDGRPLLEELSAASFPAHALRVAGVLVELARASAGAAATPSVDRCRRLVEEPLARFEREFGAVLAPGALAAARDALGGLGEVPAAIEHRDCSPWNVLLGPNGDPILLDWESAEPCGLAGLDLVYFLANCAFVLDGAIESGRTRESYARLLDPASAHGRVFAEVSAGYLSALGISTADFDRLRLLCWVVHSHSDYLHLLLESPAPAPQALRRAPFPGLVEAELERT